MGEGENAKKSGPLVVLAKEGGQYRQAGMGGGGKGAENYSPVSGTNVSVHLSSQISQSETKLETKEESQLEEEGASISQDQLSLQ